MRDTRSSFMTTPIDDTPLSIGKYKGQTPRQVARSDPSYVTWLRANVLPPVVSRELALECEGRQDDGYDLDDIDE